ncbi:MAG: hypothetical protein O3B31_15600 [Chloroflexi bacterium]|nr:hypothetical protein [Chloroflexota bacterium]
MHSGMIGKIEKAHRYAQERERFHFRELSVMVHGNNDDHEVILRDGRWQCACDFFIHNAACAHSMALEALLDGMLPASATQLPAQPLAHAS